MRLILASGSPRRRELISTLGIPFEVIKSDIDETQHTNEAPFDYVERLSIEKAHAVALKTGDSLPILAADTIVVLGAEANGVDEQGEILGKPADADEARTMLKRLRGRAHLVCTAVTLYRGGDDPKQLTQRAVTTVTMRDYSDAEMDAYIASGDPFDKAGSYAIQNEAFAPVECIDGDYNNVVGLPLEMVKPMLSAFGFLFSADS
ncbi:MAG: Maf family protein [Aggregatilineales bacterium]